MQPINLQISVAVPSASDLCGTAGIIFFVAGRFFGHLLAPGDSENAQN